MNSKRIQFVVGGVVFLLLAAVGLVGLGNANSLAQVEETLNKITTSVFEQSGETSVPTPTPVSEPIAQPTASTSSNTVSQTTSEETPKEEEVTPVADKSEGPQPLEVLVPGDGNSVILSSLYPQIQIQLRITQPVTAASVTARLLIVNQFLPESKKEPLTQGFSSDEPTSPLSTTTNLTLTFPAQPPSGTYEGWLIITGEGIPPSSRRLTVEVSTVPTDTRNVPAFTNVRILLPGDDKIIAVTKDHPQVDFSLQSLSARDNATVTAQLLVVQKYNSDKDEILSQGFASSNSEIVLQPYETKNVTVTFEQLPPTGKYTARLLVSGKNSQLVNEPVTLTVSSEPQIAIQHRLTNAPAGEKNITIGGFRYGVPFCLFGWCTADGGNYELKLWEAGIQKSECRIVASELADKTSGRSGTLDVIPVDPCENAEPEQFPVTAILKPNIVYPGSYTGTLRIIVSGDVQNEVISVTAQMRDTLWWPAVVIFIGAMLSGFAVRYRLGDTDNNLAFQRHLIVLERERLKRVGVQGEAGSQIETLLDTADLALDLNDYQKASYYLKQAVDELNKYTALKENLDSAKNIMKNNEPTDNTRKSDWNNLERSITYALNNLKTGDLVRAQKYYDQYTDEAKQFQDEAPVTKTVTSASSHLEIKRQSEVNFLPAARIVVTPGEKFSIRSPDTLTYHYEVIEPRRFWRDKRKPLAPRDINNPKYVPKKPGRYVIRIEPKDEYAPPYSLEVFVIDPVKQSAWKVRLSSVVAMVIWALGATVTGLLYIESRVPTFGSPMDYFFAFAFALGIGAVAKPTENITANALKKLSGNETAQPNKPDKADGSGEEDETRNGGQVTVPDIPEDTTQTEASKLLEEVGLKAKFEPPNAEKNWLVDHIDPEAGTSVEKNSFVTCYLQKPPNGTPPEEKSEEEQTNEKGKESVSGGGTESNETPGHTPSTATQRSQTKVPEKSKSAVTSKKTGSVFIKPSADEAAAETEDVEVEID